MYRLPLFSPAQDKTTVASGIFRIILYDFTFFKHLAHVRSGNHAIRP